MDLPRIRFLGHSTLWIRGPRLTHGPDSRAMDHLLEADGLRIYVSGDTGLFGGLGDIAAQGPIDLAAGRSTRVPLVPSGEAVEPQCGSRSGR